MITEIFLRTVFDFDGDFRKRDLFRCGVDVDVTSARMAGECAAIVFELMSGRDIDVRFLLNGEFMLLISYF